MWPRVYVAMSSAVFWIQRDEGTCRKRCRDIQEVLVENLPATKKFSMIFALMDQYTDEDSDVNLLSGVEISKSGPVCIPAKTAAGHAAQDLIPLTAPQPSCNSAVPLTPDQTDPAVIAAGALKPGEPRTAVAKSLPYSDVIEKNRQEALERRARQKAQARDSEQQQVFQAMQWLPS